MTKLLDSIKLSSDTLKIIACITMFIDHASYCLLNYYMSVFHMDILPQDYSTYNTIYNIGRGIGRIAFPIFCFFLVEGFLRTKAVHKYATRLLILAVISEVPFDLAHYHKVFNLEHQNTVFSLFAGLLMLMLLNYILNNLPTASDWFKVALSLCAVAGFSELASLAHLDYGYKGMLLIAAIYATRSLRSLQLVTGAAVSSWEANGPVAFLLLYFYDSSFKPKHKYFFYLFYPIHLIVLYLIASLLFQ